MQNECLTATSNKDRLRAGNLEKKLEKEAQSSPTELPRLERLKSDDERLESENQQLSRTTDDVADGTFEEGIC